MHLIYGIGHYVCVQKLMEKSKEAHWNFIGYISSKENHCNNVHLKIPSFHTFAWLTLNLERPCFGPFPLYPRSRKSLREATPAGKFYPTTDWRLHYVDFSSIVRHSPSHGQWENAGPLSGIRVDMVRDQIGLDRVVVLSIANDEEMFPISILSFTLALLSAMESWLTWYWWVTSISTFR